jgi:hypothetical protein
MIKEHIIARTICHKYINTKSSFYMDDLVSDIIKHNGIARVSTGVTITQHILNNYNVDAIYTDNGLYIINKTI